MTNPTQFYSAKNDECQCNMVSYALFEACQNCQFDNGTAVTSYVLALVPYLQLAMAHATYALLRQVFAVLAQLHHAKHRVGVPSACLLGSWV